MRDLGLLRRPGSHAFGFLLAIFLLSSAAAVADNLTKVQECLTFTQFYQGLADGKAGHMTDAAVKAFQRSLYQPETGALSADQASLLFSRCEEKKRALGWAPFRLRSGTVVDLPLGILQQTGSSMPEVAVFEGLDKELGVVVFSHSEATSQNLNKAYENAIQLAEVVSYKVYRENWFVVSGTGANGAFLYSYARLDGARLFGYGIIWTSNVGPLIGGVAIMILNSFKQHDAGGGDAPAVWAAAPVPMRPPERPSQAPIGAQPERVSLSAAQIFKRTKDAVWVLLSFGLKGGDPDWDNAAQGSAIAVGPYTLLTNCHTLEHHAVHGIVQKDMDAPIAVEVARADYAHDKCILKTGRRLPAYVEVRSYATIEVGEEAYSVGAPKGLDLTIANGIVSGKRLVKGINYLQTTAPISPGSSGGGLFDATGRLIGITTMFLREAQNLNFAIAADAF